MHALAVMLLGEGKPVEGVWESACGVSGAPEASVKAVPRTTKGFGSSIERTVHRVILNPQ